MVYIYTTYDLIEKIKGLDKTKKMIILLIFVMLILSISTSLLKKNMEEVDTPWDYDEVNKLKTIDTNINNTNINNTNIVNDRVKYWELSSIIDKYISSFIDESDYSYKNYYKVLTKEYKKKINKKEYNKLAYDFINMFVYQTNDGEYHKVDYNIEKVYLYDDSMYLCHIMINTDNMDDSEKSLYYKNENQDVILEKKVNGYIGIKLDEVESTYSIFYIE